MSIENTDKGWKKQSDGILRKSFPRRSVKPGKDARGFKPGRDGGRPSD